MSYKQIIPLQLFCQIWIILSVFGLISEAYAYIGPGAGFAVAGSFLVMFTAMLSAIIAFLTWPIRGLIRAIRFRRIYARSRFKKVVVLGLDGMDCTLTEKWLSEGKLPNFAKLRDQGCFKPLSSTIPPISPVAWSSFQTGSNPGKTNIFDFLTRDIKSYDVKLSSVDIKGPTRKIKIGKYQIPIGSGDIRLLRKSIPFWKILGNNGIFSSVIRVPITFPPEKFFGVQLSAMCTPDLRGSQGMFSYFTSQSNDRNDSTGGEHYTVKIKKDRIKTKLIGPQNPMLTTKSTLTCPFEVILNGADSATLKINGKTYQLVKDEYSNWIKVDFQTFPGAKISGIGRFLLKSTQPEFRLYVTPINIDPEKPVMPISHPPVYSTYISKRQGDYATLGLAEDSWALNEKLISDDDFIQQCLQADDEREKMFFDSLDNIKQGLCVCVFDGTDRIQHAFWRQMDKEHPVHNGDFKPSNNLAIENIYKRADLLLGKVMKKCNNKDTLLMIISDHGFNVFRYGIDLNRWLADNGYLTLKEDAQNKKNLAGVDWSETRAFAIGLSGIFLNIKGRESRGIVDPKTEAPKLREEIAEKLHKLTDPIRNQPAVKQVYNAWKVYHGPYRNNAPDLIVGYQVGYRASWETAVGQVTEQIFHDNMKAWSGDHCIDHSLVPGILFCNQKITNENPRLMDIGPTVLDMFGVDIPTHMDGQPLTVS
ncbi:MAG: nucleotide pyrophosphatase [Desulfobacteraceae bacterium]|nr:alkaline phosphatase family protein [Desulfobacteraceae bacterium]MBC2755332.1 nucleotide pyrophosphatase [Desulfobacteraceae bacterium]